MMIELSPTVKGKQTFAAGTKMLFDTNLMSDVQSEGTGASFYLYNGSLFNEAGKVYYHVTDSYASIKAALSAATPLANPAQYEKEVWAMFDAGVAANKTVAAHSLVDPVTLLPVQLPTNAIITEALLLVETNFTSGTSMATISLGCAVDAVAGLKAATLVSNAAYQATAPIKFTALTPVETAASSITPLTAPRTIDATVAVEALTAGKLKVLVRYTVKP